MSNSKTTPSSCIQKVFAAVNFYRFEHVVNIFISHPGVPRMKTCNQLTDMLNPAFHHRKTL